MFQYLLVNLNIQIFKKNNLYIEVNLSQIFLN